MTVDLSLLIVSATKPNGTPAAMLAQMGVTIVPIEEDEGDVDRYVISKRVAIERRTGSAFLKGIMEKTLFTSALYLREHFRIPILIVEGEVDYESTRFDPQAVRGALTSMMLQYGVSVLSTPDLEETVALIVMIARQEQIGIPKISLIPKRKAVDLADQQRRVIEMLPGCGRVCARDLLQHFGSVKRIANATRGELREQRAIGAKKAREICRVLNAEYESVDTERNLEDAIAAEPQLLFRTPLTLLARQHHIFAEEKQKHVVDMVFLDSPANQVVLVELKRGCITADHVTQLRRYLGHAGESKLLLPLLERGVSIRGILATVEPGGCEPDRADMSVRVVDRRRCIKVLRRLRRGRRRAKVDESAGRT